jgi:hypothetical protein
MNGSEIVNEHNRIISGGLVDSIPMQWGLAEWAICPWTVTTQCCSSRGQEGLGGNKDPSKGNSSVGRELMEKDGAMGQELTNIDKQVVVAVM